MKIQATYACGHTTTFDAYRHGSDEYIAQRRTELGLKPCYKCERAQQAEVKAARIAELNATMVALEGTARQVEWAETLRYERYAAIEKTIHSSRVAIAKEGLGAIVDAKFFIDFRSLSDHDFWSIVLERFPVFAAAFRAAGKAAKAAKAEREFEQACIDAEVAFEATAAQVSEVSEVAVEQALEALWNDPRQLSNAIMALPSDKRETAIAAVLGDLNPQQAYQAAHRLMREVGIIGPVSNPYTPACQAIEAWRKRNHKRGAHTTPTKAEAAVIARELARAL